MSAGTVMKWMKPVRWRLAPAAMPMAMLAVLLVGGTLFPAAGTLANAPDPVTRAEAWFDGISTMKADFIQVASDGTTATGELHLRRPHRMKIIYDLDEPLILLLQEQVELRSDEFRTSHSVRNGITRIVLTKDTGEAAGQLTLEFTNQPFVLRKWSIRDAADVTTTVTLQNMRFGHSYENKFFAKTIYPDENQ